MTIVRFASVCASSYVALTVTVVISNLLEKWLATVFDPARVFEFGVPSSRFDTGWSLFCSQPLITGRRARHIHVGAATTEAPGPGGSPNEGGGEKARRASCVLLEELQAAGRHGSKEGRVQSRSNTVHVQTVCANDGILTPTAPELRASQSNAGDMVEDVTPARGRDRQQPPHPGVTPSAEENRPILVDLDAISSHNADKSADHVGRKRTADTSVRRVHCQPRLRVVPCVRKLLGVADNESDGDASAGGNPPSNPNGARYKDPPGYENVRDFGSGEDLHYKPPLLQPKTHGVSVRSTLENN